ncbi:uncharacterized protein VTP21DRAFT_5265 [Calcarisporiella thermophila]|uniref:uncharacterized protein n=1 Tax=Calcarisporiella thermophila TaxID=911321 RepID=UPI003744645B
MSRSPLPEYHGAEHLTHPPPPEFSYIIEGNGINHSTPSAQSRVRTIGLEDMSLSPVQTSQDASHSFRASNYELKLCFIAWKIYTSRMRQIRAHMLQQWLFASKVHRRTLFRRYLSLWRTMAIIRTRNKDRNIENFRVGRVLLAWKEAVKREQLIVEELCNTWQVRRSFKIWRGKMGVQGGRVKERSISKSYDDEVTRRYFVAWRRKALVNMDDAEKASMVASYFSIRGVWNTWVLAKHRMQLYGLANSFQRACLQAICLQRWEQKYIAILDTNQKAHPFLQNNLYHIMSCHFQQWLQRSRSIQLQNATALSRYEKKWFAKWQNKIGYLERSFNEGLELGDYTVSRRYLTHWRKRADYQTQLVLEANRIVMKRAVYNMKIRFKTWRARALFRQQTIRKCFKHWRRRHSFTSKATNQLLLRSAWVNWCKKLVSRREKGAQSRTRSDVHLLSKTMRLWCVQLELLNQRQKEADGFHYYALLGNMFYGWVRKSSYKSKFEREWELLRRRDELRRALQKWRARARALKFTNALAIDFELKGQQVVTKKIFMKWTSRYDFMRDGRELAHVYRWFSMERRTLAHWFQNLHISHRRSLAAHRFIREMTVHYRFHLWRQTYWCQHKLKDYMSEKQRHWFLKWREVARRGEKEARIWKTKVYMKKWERQVKIRERERVAWEFWRRRMADRCIKIWLIKYFERYPLRAGAKIPSSDGALLLALAKLRAHARVCKQQQQLAADLWEAILQRRLWLALRTASNKSRQLLEMLEEKTKQRNRALLRNSFTEWRLINRAQLNLERDVLERHRKEVTRMAFDICIEKTKSSTKLRAVAVNNWELLLKSQTLSRWRQKVALDRKRESEVEGKLRTAQQRRAFGIWMKRWVVSQDVRPARAGKANRERLLQQSMDQWFRRLHITARNWRRASDWHTMEKLKISFKYWNQKSILYANEQRLSIAAHRQYLYRMLMSHFDRWKLIMRLKQLEQIEETIITKRRMQIMQSVMNKLERAITIRRRCEKAVEIVLSRGRLASETAQKLEVDAGKQLHLFRAQCRFFVHWKAQFYALRKLMRISEDIIASRSRLVLLQHIHAWRDTYLGRELRRRQLLQVFERKQQLEAMRAHFESRKLKVDLSAAWERWRTVMEKRHGHVIVREVLRCWRHWSTLRRARLLQLKSKAFQSWRKKNQQWQASKQLAQDFYRRDLLQEAFTIFRSHFEMPSQLQPQPDWIHQWKQAYMLHRNFLLEQAFEHWRMAMADRTFEAERKMVYAASYHERAIKQRAMLAWWLYAAGMKERTPQSVKVNPRRQRLMGHDRGIARRLF